MSEPKYTSRLGHFSPDLHVESTPIDLPADFDPDATGTPIELPADFDPNAMGVPYPSDSTETE